jgi:hypothetical protein
MTVIQSSADDFMAELMSRARLDKTQAMDEKRNAASRRRTPRSHSEVYAEAFQGGERFGVS